MGFFRSCPWIRQKSYYLCGFQVIDPTVAWILSRVGPTIRRGHRFVPYCTTVVVCILRLLAVLVSLKHYSAPPLLYTRVWTIKMSVPLYWCTISKSNSTYIIEPKPNENTPRIQKIRKKNIINYTFLQCFGILHISTKMYSILEKKLKCY